VTCLLDCSGLRRKILGDNTHQYISRSVIEINARLLVKVLEIAVTVIRKRKCTHVRIPPGLFSIATTAELTFNSSIFFDAVKTVSDGATVTTLKN
jgi:hypothetical protein